MNQQYVGFGARLIALILDYLVLILLEIVIIVPLGMMTGSGFQKNSSIDLFGNLIGFVLGISYFVFYQAKMGQTLGKKAMGIRVVTAEGKTPSVGVFFLREIIGKWISWLILGIGFWMVLWDGKKQGLHDKIAGTYVVKVTATPVTQPVTPAQPVGPANSVPSAPSVSPQPQTSVPPAQ